MDVVESPLQAISADPVLPSGLRNRIAREFSARWREQWGGKFVLHGRPTGPDAVRLDGNDYLSVTGHPDIVQAQVAALREDSELVVQSGVFQLDSHPAHTFEKSLAHWIGKEDGLLCQSGYAANLGLLQVIADEQTPVYLDSLAHMSLWEGARAAGAPAHAFRHNDPAHLDRMAQGAMVPAWWWSTRSTARPAPCARCAPSVEVAEQHDCMILVDESHSLGTHGPQGAGLCAHAGPHRPRALHHRQPGQGLRRACRLLHDAAQLRSYLMCHSYPEHLQLVPAAARSRRAWRPR